MFVGHYAVGLAAKRVAPNASLGALFFACQAADLLWPMLLFAGLETVQVHPGDTAFTPLTFVSYPYSHSLLGLALFGCLVAAAWRVAGATPRTAVILGLVVASHWVLDAVVHRPDLPLTPGGEARVGLGVWNAPWATVIIECAALAWALGVYTRVTRARDRSGSVGLWVLIGTLLVVYAGNVLGPPPPSDRAIAWAAQALWIPVIWAGWVDRHRARVP